MSCTHETKEGGAHTPCTAKDGHDDDHCRGQAAAPVDKPSVVSAPAVLAAQPSNAATAATSTPQHVVWFGEEVPVDKLDRANEFEPVAAVTAVTPVTAAAAAVGTSAPSALSPTQAQARLAAFSYRNRRLRPVNQDDPISLEPLDMSTAFPLIDERGVVTAFNAFRCESMSGMCVVCVEQMLKSICCLPPPASSKSDLCAPGGHGALCPWRKPGVPLPRSGKL